MTPGRGGQDPVGAKEQVDQGEGLVSIHPWADGNGRMSRSLQTLLIAREGVLAPEFSSIEAWLGRPGNSWEYYQELPGRVRRARYEQAEGLTVQQAQRDLRDLVAAGLLEPVGRTRARYYTTGPDADDAAPAVPGCVRLTGWPVCQECSGNPFGLC